MQTLISEWPIKSMRLRIDGLFMFYRGDVVQVDTWVSASGKNGMRRDWLVRDCKTGQILTRASR